MLGRDWREPVLVKTIVITRPGPAADAFWQVLDANLPGKFRPIFAPLIEIVAVEAEIDLEGVDGLVFSSVNAVEQFAQRWPERTLIAWCVGDATRDAAVAAGFTAVSAGGNGADLETLIHNEANATTGNLLHVRGAHSTGLPVPSVVIYDQVAKPLDQSTLAELHVGVDVVTFFSPRTAQLFAENVAGRGLNFADAMAVCLSAAIALGATGVGFGRVIACDRPNTASMMDQLQRLV